MHVDDFLARLDGVKKTARGWLAKCPAHDDKRPSMTVATGDDGRILMHCWSGCGADEIVAVLGIELSDLFPPRPAQDYVPGLRAPFPAADVLAAVEREVFLVAYMAAALANAPVGYGLTDTDRAILWQSFDRLMEARRLSLGER